jgi:hypothetical protein
MGTPDSNARLAKAALRLLVRGEFRERDAVLLIAVYSAAILAIPLLLNSIFQLSSSSLLLVTGPSIQSVLHSIYAEASLSYLYVDALVFVGFGIICLLAGMAFGRRATKVMTILSHIGIEKGSISRSMALLILFSELAALVVGFALAIVVSSATVFLISTAFGLQYILPVIGLQFILFLVTELVLGYLCLAAGWRVTSRRTLGSIQSV